jgi:hypothetical protein
MQIKHGKGEQVSGTKVTRETVSTASFMNDHKPERQRCFGTATAPVSALSQTNQSFRERKTYLGVPYTAQTHLTLGSNLPYKQQQ